MEADNLFFDTSDYEIKSEKLGNGMYGTVYIAENIKSNEKFATKIINTEKDFDGHDQMLFLRESLILHKLDHPSIVKFIGINFKSFSDPKLLEPTIITEYLPKGSLKDNLLKEESSLSDSDWTPTKKYIHLLGISDALRYLHEQGIAHRDLKPENILVDSDYYPRICDFGLSKCFPESLTKTVDLTISGKFGTPLYLPPEVLEEKESYDQSVDVYAFSMIAYEIVTGRQPFSELIKKSPFEVIKKIINGDRPKFTPSVTEKMKNLISRCWSQKPKERPTFEEIFNELSSDFSYFNETVDEEEIEKYLDLLNEPNEEREVNDKNQTKDIKKLKKELDELKKKKIH